MLNGVFNDNPTEVKSKASLINQFMDPLGERNPTSHRRGRKCKLCAASFDHNKATDDTLISHLKTCENMDESDREYVLSSLSMMRIASKDNKFPNAPHPVKGNSSTPYSPHSRKQRDLITSEEIFADQKTISEMDRFFSLWVTTSSISPAEIDNPFFHTFIKLIQPKYVLPSRNELEGRLTNSLASASLLELS
jgi:hypothetical protein